MIDFRKIVNSTDFLKELRKLVPEKERTQFDEWIDDQIDQHQEVCNATAARMQQEVEQATETEQDVDKKSDQ